MRSHTETTQVVELKDTLKVNNFFEVSSVDSLSTTVSTKAGTAIVIYRREYPAATWFGR